MNALWRETMEYCVYCGAKTQGIKSMCTCGRTVMPMLKLEELPYVNLSTSIISEFEQQDVYPPFGKGDRKKMIKSILDGTCGTCKVKYDSTHRESDSADVDVVTTYSYYHSLSTVEGNPIAEAVQRFFGGGDDVPDEMYILRHTVKNKFRYMLIDSDDPAYIIENTKSIVNATSMNTRAREIAKREDSFFGKKGFVAKLFGKN